MSYVYNRMGEFTTENCVTVKEDCEVTYTTTTDKTNLKETVAAVHSCEVIKED